MWKGVGSESIYFIDKENEALKEIAKEQKKHVEDGCDCVLIPYGFRCNTHKFDMVWNGEKIEVKKWK